MSSGVFRGKESSNRIELSRLVQDLLNFSVLGSLWLWGGGRWVGGVWGHLRAWRVSPTHAHACTCMHMHAHVCMYRNCKWPLTWKHPCLSCLACLTCMCMHVCACIHAWDTPTPLNPPPPPSIHPPPLPPRR